MQYIIIKPESDFSRKIIPCTFSAAFVCGATTIIASVVTLLAKQDAWISVIVATLFGMIVIWIYTYMGGLYPWKFLRGGSCRMY